MHTNNYTVASHVAMPFVYLSGHFLVAYVVFLSLTHRLQFSDTCTIGKIGG